MLKIRFLTAVIIASALFAGNAYAQAKYSHHKAPGGYRPHHYKTESRKTMCQARQECFEMCSSDSKKASLNTQTIDSSERKVIERPYLHPKFGRPPFRREVSEKRVCGNCASLC